MIFQYTDCITKILTEYYKHKTISKKLLIFPNVWCILQLQEAKWKDIYSGLKCCWLRRWRIQSYMNFREHQWMFLFFISSEHLAGRGETMYLYIIHLEIPIVFLKSFGAYNIQLIFEWYNLFMEKSYMRYCHKFHNQFS